MVPAEAVACFRKFDGTSSARARINGDRVSDVMRSNFRREDKNETLTFILSAQFPHKTMQFPQNNLIV